MNYNFYSKSNTANIDYKLTMLPTSQEYIDYYTDKKLELNQLCGGLESKTFLN